MRPLVSNIFFLFAFLFSNGQSINHDAKKFILNFYETRNSGSYFVYTKGINTYEQKEIIKAIQKSDTLKNWERVNNKILFSDSLFLTAQEKQLLIAKIQNQIDTSLWNGIGISVVRKTCFRFLLAQEIYFLNR